MRVLDFPNDLEVPGDLREKKKMKKKKKKEECISVASGKHMKVQLDSLR